jgi:hypothetical protein
MPVVIPSAGVRCLAANGIKNGCANAPSQLDRTAPSLYSSKLFRNIHEEAG